MRIAFKPSHRNHFPTLSGSRLAGAPVVQPEVSKVSLGSVANPYLSNLTEAVTATAVISSIGQVPPSFLSGEKAQVPAGPSVQFQPLNLITSHAVQTNVAPSLLSDIPIQAISSLSESASNIHAVSTVSTLPSQPISVDNLQIGEARSNIAYVAQDPIISIELFSLASPTAVSPVGALSTGAVSSGVSMSQVAANDVFNLGGLSSLINQAAVSSVTTLSTGTQTVAESQQVAPQLFDGITVSGQADGIEFLIMATKAQTPASFINTDVSLFAVEQHSIILISVSMPQPTEAFGL